MLAALRGQHASFAELTPQAGAFAMTALIAWPLAAHADCTLDGAAIGSIAALENGQDLACNNVVLSDPIRIVSGATETSITLGDSHDGAIDTWLQTTHSGSPPDIAAAIALGANSSARIHGNAAVSSAGNDADGIRLVGDGSSVGVSGGTIATSGAGSVGITARGNGNEIVLDEATLSTLKEDSYGIRVDGDDNTISLDGSELSTESDTSTGLYVTGRNNVIDLIDSSISTKGDDANGILRQGSEEGGTISLIDSSITSEGINSSAVYLFGRDYTITMNGGSLVTRGELSHGIASATGGATINVNGGSISASGPIGLGIIAVGGDSTVTLTGGSIAVTGDNADAIRMRGGGNTVTLNSGSLSGSGEGGRAIGIFTVAGKTDQLTINTAVSLTGNTHAEGEGIATLSLTGGDTRQYGDNVSGFDSLTVRDGGSWTLDGDVTDVATIDIAAGSLIINGDASGSNVSIAAGSHLGGSGSVGEIDVLRRGVLSPGNSIGTLTVDGDITFAQGSTFEVEVNRAGEGDLVAAGAAAIEGGTVHVLAENRIDNGSTYDPVTSYVILTAEDGITGSFDAVTDDFAFLKPRLDYEDTQILLTLERNSVGYADLAFTRNQAAAASGIENLSSDELVNSILALTEEEARNAYDQISGEVHASIKSGLLNDATGLRRTISERLDGAFDRVRTTSPSPLRPGRMTIWADAIGAGSDTKSDCNAADFSQTSGTFLAGAEATLGSGMIGALLGHGQSSFSANDLGSSGSSQSFHAGLYGESGVGNVLFKSGLAYSYSTIETSRRADFGGFSDQLTASYGSGALQALGGVSYGIVRGPHLLEGYADVAHVMLSSGAFHEKGGAAALSGEGGQSAMTYSSLGVRGSFGVPTRIGSLTLSAELGWQHAFGDTHPLSSQHFAGGKSFSVAGVPIAENLATIGAGLSFARGNRLALNLSYEGNIAHDFARNVVKGGISFRF
ncbi:autotransporter domain-containing protein [Rhodobacterales bacterium]|nr:autotransporter domain-containing protein [Rhodobacterales bacterium]